MEIVPQLHLTLNPAMVAFEWVVCTIENIDVEIMNV